MYVHMFTCFILLSFAMRVVNYVLLLLCKAAIIFLGTICLGFLENNRRVLLKKIFCRLYLNFSNKEEKSLLLWCICLVGVLFAYGTRTPILIGLCIWPVLGFCQLLLPLRIRDFTDFSVFLLSFLNFWCSLLFFLYWRIPCHLCNITFRPFFLTTYFYGISNSILTLKLKHRMHFVW